MPGTFQSLTSFRTLARARKAGSSEWNLYTYDVHKTLFWFFTIEYATLNSQADFTTQLTPEGYHQGGLGAGVTIVNSSWWSEYNSQNPLIPCNVAIRLGNNTGIIEYGIPPMVHGDAPVVVSVSSYRGIVNPFGHIWKYVDGINVLINPNEDSGGDGLSYVYICDEPSQYKDYSAIGYNLRGHVARYNGFINEIIFGEKGEFIPKEANGSNSTYFCDNLFTSIPETGEWRGVRLGGGGSSSNNAGLVCVAISRKVDYTLDQIGTRLCFIPQSSNP